MRALPDDVSSLTNAPPAVGGICNEKGVKEDGGECTTEGRNKNQRTSKNLRWRVEGGEEEDEVQTKAENKQERCVQSTDRVDLNVIKSTGLSQGEKMIKRKVRFKLPGSFAAKMVTRAVRFSNAVGPPSQVLEKHSLKRQQELGDSAYETNGPLPQHPTRVRIIHRAQAKSGRRDEGKQSISTVSCADTGSSSDPPENQSGAWVELAPAPTPATLAGNQPMLAKKLADIQAEKLRKRQERFNVDTVTTTILAQGVNLPKGRHKESTQVAPSILVLKGPCGGLEGRKNNQQAEENKRERAEQQAVKMEKRKKR
ncbi:unnamed protein product [Choristocarpus tenellus]